MALKQPLTAPGQQAMAAAPLGPHFNHHDGLFIKQTPRGWIWEIIGCSSRNEYKVSKLNPDWNELLSGGVFKETQQKHPDELYSLEKSSCLVRNCCREARRTVIHVSTGAEEGGNPILEYHKPLGCHVGWCCCLPEFTTKRPDGSELNASKYVFSCCVPQLSFQEPPGTEVYRIHPPSCCGGMCVQCECGKGCGTIPFYFYNPTTGEQIVNVEGEEFPPQIRVVRQGMAKACCTTANNFAVKFPKDASAETKAGILGMVFLVDMAFFEKQQQK